MFPQCFPIRVRPASCSPRCATANARITAATHRMSPVGRGTSSPHRVHRSTRFSASTTVQPGSLIAHYSPTAVEKSTATPLRSPTPVPGPQGVSVSAECVSDAAIVSLPAFTRFLEQTVETVSGEEARLEGGRGYAGPGRRGASPAWPCPGSASPRCRSWAVVRPHPCPTSRSSRSARTGSAPHALRQARGRIGDSPASRGLVDRMDTSDLWANRTLYPLGIRQGFGLRVLRGRTDPAADTDRPVRPDVH